MTDGHRERNTPSQIIFVGTEIEEWIKNAAFVPGIWRTYLLVLCAACIYLSHFTVHSTHRVRLLTQTHKHGRFLVQSVHRKIPIKFSFVYFIHFGFHFHHSFEYMSSRRPVCHIWSTYSGLFRCVWAIWSVCLSVYLSVYLSRALRSTNIALLNIFIFLVSLFSLSFHVVFLFFKINFTRCCACVCVVYVSENLLFISDCITCIGWHTNSAFHSSGLQLPTPTLTSSNFDIISVQPERTKATATAIPLLHLAKHK